MLDTKDTAMSATIALDQDYTFYIGTYSDIDVLAHQPYAPTEGKGLHTAKMSKDGTINEGSATEVLNPAVLIPHSNGNMLYAIVETIKPIGAAALNEKPNKDHRSANESSARQKQDHPIAGG